MPLQLSVTQLGDRQWTLPTLAEQANRREGEVISPHKSVADVGEGQEVLQETRPPPLLFLYLHSSLPPREPNATHRTDAQIINMPGIQGKPRTLYDKVFQDHIVDEKPDGTVLLYIGKSRKQDYLRSAC